MYHFDLSFNIMGKIGKNSDRSINYVNAHGHGNAATTFFAHAHGVYMDPAARSATTLLEVRDVEAV
jgi:hypothetical protein